MWVFAGGARETRAFVSLARDWRWVGVFFLVGPVRERMVRPFWGPPSPHKTRKRKTFNRPRPPPPCEKLPLFRLETRWRRARPFGPHSPPDNAVHLPRPAEASRERSPNLPVEMPLPRRGGPRGSPSPPKTPLPRRGASCDVRPLKPTAWPLTPRRGVCASVWCASHLTTDAPTCRARCGGEAAP